MGVFNALIAVRGDRTHIEYNLAIELEQLVKPWMEGRFDWYAIGAEWWSFAAYLDPVHGCWIDGNEEELAQWLANPPSGYVLVPIRCHSVSR